MEKISSHTELLQAIQQLETAQEESWQILKEQIIITKNNVKPFDILANAFKKELMPKLFSNDFLRSAVGLTAGFLAKSYIIGSSINPVKLILGNLVQWNTTQLLVKNAGTIPQIISGFKHLFTKKQHTLLDPANPINIPANTIPHPHD